MQKESGCGAKCAELYLVQAVGAAVEIENRVFDLQATAASKLLRNSTSLDVCTF